MATQHHVQNSDQMAFKLTILKKGILEERQKTADLQKENNNLQEDLQTQKEIVNKLQEEIVQLRNNTGKKQLTKFFNNFFEGEEDEEQHNKLKEDRINSLEGELEELKDQVNSMQKEKNFINIKLNEQIKQYEELKQESKYKMDEIHRYYKEKEQYEVDDSTRINSMSEVIKKLEREKIENEKTIEIYEKDKKNKCIEISILFKEQNLLIDELEALRKEIQEVKEENTHLNMIIEDLTPITRKTVFKGIMILSVRPRRTVGIEFTFGKIDNALVITEAENQKGVVIDLMYILCINRVEDNKIEIITSKTNHEEKYVIEIRPRFIEYILKMYKDIISKKEVIEDKTINNLFISSSIRDCFV